MPERTRSELLAVAYDDGNGRIGLRGPFGSADQCTHWLGGPQPAWVVRLVPVAAPARPARAARGSHRTRGRLRGA